MASRRLSGLVWLALLAGRAWAAQVLVVADEFPAMEVLGAALRAKASAEVQLVAQTNLPPQLRGYAALIVYIHGRLGAPAEQAFLEYANAGGKLVLLHHSISSGKRQNRDWFPALGVELPEGEPAQGGYKWTEPADLILVNLAPEHYVTTHQVTYPEQVPYRREAEGAAETPLPGFTLPHSEVYLNHQLTGKRTVLMGFKYIEPATGRVWMQDRAAWYKPLGKGWVFYFKAGHSAQDFRHATYAQVLANVVTFQPSGPP
jgi:hypothetical protein